MGKCLIGAVLFHIFISVAYAAVNPSKININYPNLFPYGLEYSSSTGFLVSSLTTGTVYKVSDTGVLTPFVQDSYMQSVLGIQIDTQRNALWIVNSNITFVEGGSPIFSQISQLIRADLTTGGVLARVDLSSIRRSGYTGNLLPTDVINDIQGNVYIVDSLQGIVIKVDTSLTPSLFATDARFYEVESGALYGLTGIVATPGNFLIVGKNGSGRLFKISMTNPSNIVEIPVTGSLNGLDGLNLIGNGAIIASGGNQVAQLFSADRFTTASVVSTDVSLDDVSTNTARDADNYVISAHTLDFFAGAPRTTFEIVKVNLPASSTSITINSLNLYPYGMDWNVKSGFLLGSVSQGIVYQLNEGTGSVSPFTIDSRFVSIAGIQIDAARDLVYVTNTNAPYGTVEGGTVNAFAALSLTTGAVVKYVDLSNLKREGYTGKLYVHDITSDSDGNVYITEGLSGVIYKIDATTNVASIFATNPSWQVIEPGQVNGIDGIDFVKGYLIVGKSGSGRLFKVQINPSILVTEVRLAANTTLTGLDSITTRPNGNLCIVGGNSVVEVASHDNFATAYTFGQASGFNSITVCANRNNNAMVLSGHLEELIQKRNRFSYELNQVTFTYPPPVNISLKMQDLFPYGLDWIPQGFVVGSLKLPGTVYLVDDFGTITPFITDTNLKQIVGIQSDPLWNNIYIATSDVGFHHGGIAFGSYGGILIADMSTGATKTYVDLSSATPEPNFFSDVTADNAGNIYVLESITGVVLKIAQGSRVVSQFAKDDSWSQFEDGSAYGISGIDYYVDAAGEYLIVGKTSTTSSQLFKIALPSGTITPVILHANSPPIVGLEGLNFNGNTLLATGRGGIYSIVSQDAFTTATVQFANTSVTDVSTVCGRGGVNYYAVAHLNEFYLGESVSEFYISKVEFTVNPANPFVQFIVDNSSAVATGFIVALFAAVIIAALIVALIVMIILYVRARNSPKNQQRMVSSPIHSDIHSEMNE